MINLSIIKTKSRMKTLGRSWRRNSIHNTFTFSWVNTSLPYTLIDLAWVKYWYRQTLQVHNNRNLTLKNSNTLSTCNVTRKTKCPLFWEPRWTKCPPRLRTPRQPWIMEQELRRIVPIAGDRNCIFRAILGVQSKTKTVMRYWEVWFAISLKPTSPITNYLVRKKKLKKEYGLYLIPAEVKSQKQVYVEVEISKDYPMRRLVKGKRYSIFLGLVKSCVESVWRKIP